MPASARSLSKKKFGASSARRNSKLARRDSQVSARFRMFSRSISFTIRPDRTLITQFSDSPVVCRAFDVAQSYVDAATTSARSGASTATAMSAVTLSTVLNMSGNVSSAMSMPIASTGNPIAT